jgi:hypothetical protein
VTTDCRDVPLDEFEQEMLDGLLRAQADLGRQAVPMTRRSRTRRRWRVRMVAVALASLVTAGGAFAAVSLLVGSSPPVRLPGGKDLCPLGYAYVANLNTKLLYPPNYPGRQFPESGDIRCLVSAQAGRQAGYRMAPAPSGDTQIGPLYLAATPADVRSTCAAAQRQTRAIVYCPSRLPTPWLHPVINWDCPTSACSIPLLSLTGSFTAPSSYVGSAPGIGEATIWEASARQRRLYPYVVGCLAATPRLVNVTVFRGHPAAWYQCSIFGRSPSSMLEWHVGQQSYGITADGPADLRRRLILYIAAHLVAAGSGPRQG